MIQLVITGGLAAAITSVVSWLKDRRRNAADTNQIVQGIYAGSVKFADDQLDKVREDLALCNRKCDAFSDLVLQLIDQTMDQPTALARHREIQRWQTAR
ncbi:hypothetical protein CH249_14005 [Rhodococcus sp. 05-2255-3B1]|nr:hypothetical protein CH250_17300 [Rhodococcus sp. 05-2255-3C]OZE10195.1 hypothetical protein CH249_14005 [Rhodococcus sp. 05-2255-3B1]OZE25073.1 hypothetical protein CH255_00470 [Rhodococcus sp. 05-2255-2A2]OZE90204.1 hypothetical protein CH302_27520 [Rhodococcus sp. 15-2388-1-1a]